MAALSRRSGRAGTRRPDPDLRARRRPARTATLRAWLSTHRTRGRRGSLGGHRSSTARSRSSTGPTLSRSLCWSPRWTVRPCRAPGPTSPPCGRRSGARSWPFSGLRHRRLLLALEPRLRRAAAPPQRAPHHREPRAARVRRAAAFQHRRAGGAPGAAGDGRLRRERRGDLLRRRR